MTTADTLARRLDVADPGPLGLAAFALTTFVLSVFNAGLLGASAEPVVFGIALFYGGIAQLVAGAMEFLKRNVFGALAFSSYGAFWLAFWYLSTHPDFFAAGDPLKAKGVGVFLLAWTIFTVYMLIAAAHVSVGLTVTFTLLLVTFIGLTAGDLTGVKAIARTAGWFGLATALSAWYCSAAGIINATWGRQLLPVGARRLAA